MTEKPPLPTTHNIPKSLIDQWVEIPITEEVHVSLTRADLDGLFFTINNIVTSQAQVQEALVRYSNGDLDGANEQMDLSRRTNIEALNALRGLYTSLFASALRSRASSK